MEDQCRNLPAKEQRQKVHLKRYKSILIVLYNSRLTLTDCIDNESGITDFTCNDGTCVNMQQRCDLQVECVIMSRFSFYHFTIYHYRLTALTALMKRTVTCLKFQVTTGQSCNK